MDRKNTLLPHNHGSCLSSLLGSEGFSPDSTSFEEAAYCFSLMNDSTRLKIFWLLCHSEECVINISAAINMSPPATSHHLKMLKQSGLIKSRKSGKEVYYTISDSPEAELLHHAADGLLNIKCPNLDHRCACTHHDE